MKKIIVIVVLCGAALAQTKTVDYYTIVARSTKGYVTYMQMDRFDPYASVNKCLHKLERHGGTCSISTGSLMMPGATTRLDHVKGVSIIVRPGVLQSSGMSDCSHSKPPCFVNVGVDPKTEVKQ